MTKLNLAEVFFRKVEEQPDHPLILGQDTDDRTSYYEFRVGIEVLAKKLQQSGLKPGDNVGLQYPSGANYIAFVYAIWHCGACVTPLPLELTAAEKTQVFEFVHMDSVISHSRMVSQIKDHMQSEAVDIMHQAVFGKALSPCIEPEDVKGVNPAFIRFTSGTTGNAKGVVLSHDVWCKHHFA